MLSDPQNLTPRNLFQGIITEVLEDKLKGYSCKCCLTKINKSACVELKTTKNSINKKL